MVTAYCEAGHRAAHPGARARPRGDSSCGIKPCSLRTQHDEPTVKHNPSPWLNRLTFALTYRDVHHRFRSKISDHAALLVDVPRKNTIVPKDTLEPVDLLNIRHFRYIKDNNVDIAIGVQ